MVHRELVMRLYNSWKNQQIAIIDGTTLHPEFKFGYRNTLEKLLWMIDAATDKNISSFYKAAIDTVLDNLQVKDDSRLGKTYILGVKNALADFSLLVGEVPPVAVADGYIAE